MKYLLLTLLYLFSAVNTLFSQSNLQYNLNMYRDGDSIVKQQVTYRDAERSGENVLWDFSQLETIDKKYQLVYSKFVPTDSLIIGIEHRTMYKYGLSGDSLLLWGYENPTTKIRNQFPELLLRFPFQYKSRIKSYYSGKGEYCDRMDMSVMGTTQSEADAYGMIILPNKDTLRNVLRIKNRKLLIEDIRSKELFPVIKDTIRSEDLADSIEYRLSSDSIVVAVETYRWYVKGYRYPIFETIRTGNLRDSLKNEYFSTAFFYPPDEHIYLKDDKENLLVLEELRLDDELKQSRNSNSSQKGLDFLSQFSYNVYPNPVKTRLYVEYYVDRTSTISMRLYALNGHLLETNPERSINPGVSIVEINLSAYPKGEYILQIKVNENVLSEKIIKK